MPALKMIMKCKYVCLCQHIMALNNVLCVFPSYHEFFMPAAMREFGKCWMGMLVCIGAVP